MTAVRCLNCRVTFLHGEDYLAPTHLCSGQTRRDTANDSSPVEQSTEAPAPKGASVIPLFLPKQESPVEPCPA